MARVKQEVIEATKEMIDSLPEEHINTCGLCNRTLHDKLTVISVKTGAPEMTVVKEFAERYNQGKRVEDQITPNAFYERIKYLRRVNLQDLNSESHQINSECPELSTSTGDSEKVFEDNQIAGKAISNSEATESTDSSQLSSETHQINSQEANQEVSEVDPQLSGESHPINEQSDEGDTEESIEIAHIIPQDLTQPDLVDSLCQFFSVKLKGSDVIYRTFLKVMDRLAPLEAERMRRGEMIQFGDLNKAISHGIKTGGNCTLRGITDQILEGLRESNMTSSSIEQVVTMMAKEVLDK
jgi:hypothetical protein